eukprot:1384252-Amorphochlora_amoeboformis.AAC.1
MTPYTALFVASVAAARTMTVKVDRRVLPRDTLPSIPGASGFAIDVPLSNFRVCFSFLSAGLLWAKARGLEGEGDIV